MSKTAVNLVRRFYELLGSGDLETVQRELLAPDIRWHIPGHNPLAGTKRGADEVVAWLGLLGNVEYRMTLDYLDGDDEHAVEIHSGHGRLGNYEFDLSNSAFYTVKHGRLTEVQNHTSDQYALDLLYNSLFNYKPLPARLELT